MSVLKAPLIHLAKPHGMSLSRCSLVYVTACIFKDPSTLLFIRVIFYDGVVRAVLGSRTSEQGIITEEVLTWEVDLVDLAELCLS